MTTLDSPDWLNIPPTGPGAVVNNQSFTIAAAGQLTVGPVFVGHLQTVYALVSGTQGVALQVAPTFSAPGGTAIAQFGPTWYVEGYATYCVVPIAVIGPYLTVVVTNSGAGPSTGHISILGTPSGGISQLLAPTSCVIQDDSVSVAGGGSAIRHPSICAPGRYRVWAYAAGNALAYGARLVIPAVVGTFSETRQLTAAQIDLVDEFIAPAGEWEVVFYNLGAGAVFMAWAVTGPLQ